MAPTVANTHRSPVVPKFDRGGLTPAKASLPEPFALGETIWEVLVKGHDSVKDMAYRFKTDRSLLRREIVSGKLPIGELLTKADPSALADFGEFLKQQFGEGQKTKKQIAREKLPEMLALFLDAVTEDK